MITYWALRTHTVGTFGSRYLTAPNITGLHMSSIRPLYPMLW